MQTMCELAWRGIGNTYMYDKRLNDPNLLFKCREYGDQIPW